MKVVFGLAYAGCDEIVEFDDDVVYWLLCRRG